MTESGTSADAAAQKINLQDNSSLLQMPESIADAEKVKFENGSSSLQMSESGAQQQTNLLQEIRDLHKADQQENLDDEQRTRVEKLNNEERLRHMPLKRRHLIDTAGALAIVAALVGGGVLLVLISPAWAQIGAESALGACQDRGNCEMWRSLFVVSASTAFYLDIIVLLLTLGGAFSLSGCFRMFPSDTVSLLV